MDPEEKELLKKILKRVENLEMELKETKKENEELKANQAPKFQPLPPNADRFTKLVVESARKRALAKHDVQTKEKVKVEAEDLLKEYSFGELARFALKKRLLKEGKESSEVEDSGVIKVYEG